MVKKLIIIGLAFFIWTGSYAQNGDKKGKAKNLLQEVSDKIKSYDNMVIKFDYIQEDDKEHSRQKTKGEVTLKGNKYKLELMGTTRIFDGETLYDIIPEDEEVNISDYDPEDDDEISPSKMLSFYEDGYSYHWDITQDADGREIQYVKLTPEDETTEIKEILMGIDVQTKHIAKIVQILDDDSKLTIDVKSFKTDQPLSKNMFKFNEDRYKDYYINRLD